MKLSIFFTIILLSILKFRTINSLTAIEGIALAAPSDSTLSIQSHNLILLIQDKTDYKPLQQLNVKIRQSSFPIALDFSHIESVTKTDRYLLTLFVFSPDYELLWESNHFHYKLIVNQINYINFTVNDVSNMDKCLSTGHPCMETMNAISECCFPAICEPSLDEYSTCNGEILSTKNIVLTYNLQTDFTPMTGDFDESFIDTTQNLYEEISTTGVIVEITSASIEIRPHDIYYELYGISTDMYNIKISLSITTSRYCKNCYYQTVTTMTTRSIFVTIPAVDGTQRIVELKRPFLEWDYFSGSSMGPSSLIYTKPKLCVSTTWKTDATTFADDSLIGTSPYGMFIDAFKRIYVADRTNKRIQVWSDEQSYPTKTLFHNMSDTLTVLSLTAAIYAAGSDDGNIVQWVLNAADSTIALNMGARCSAIFMDNNANVYCSQDFNHKVVKRGFYDNGNPPEIVAGTGNSGSQPNELFYPLGICVDDYYNLYVADSQNRRIQFFKRGNLDGITLVGNGAPGTIDLYEPSSVTLDGDGYLFITDQLGHRIVGSGPGGFRCLVGCSGSSGSSNSQLNTPRTMAFDIYGNIFVLDSLNSRLQKFSLEKPRCRTRLCQPDCQSNEYCLNGTCIGNGNLAISLTWSRYGTANLSVKTPMNKIISVNNIGPGEDTDYGQYDINENIGYGIDNIFWANDYIPPIGVYDICVETLIFSPEIDDDHPVTFFIQVRSADQPQRVYTLTVTTSQSICITSITRQ